MKTFNLNLLGSASSVIGFQVLRWFSFEGRTQNERGHWESTYIDKGDIRGSWQPVDTTTIQNLGLDAKKQYHNFYSSSPINVFGRNESPDYFVIDSRKHEVIGGSEWYAQNGWRGILCVDVGAA